MVEPSQLPSEGKANKPFTERHSRCYLILTEKSGVQISIILGDISLLLSSPDQMAGVVGCHCIFTGFPRRLPRLVLLDLSDLGALLACGVWQMANVLVKCGANLNVVPFTF